uniref:Serine-rich protein-like protein n=1 Tax=Opuntia streptacantha TaxID=393608 RepID=A0A7C9DA51_OPUST
MAADTSRHQRSLSPSGRFCSSSISSSSSFATSGSTFSSRSTSIFHRSSSPTRVNMYGSPQTTSSLVRFSIDNRATSPNRSFSVSRNPFTASAGSATGGKKRTCLCSPTTHPGSFRCNFHKNLEAKRQSQSHMVSYSPNRLNMRRSAMTNSLVRIGTVEGGEWVKRALATLIRPSSHQQRRRADFQPRPSRLSVMSKAEDN